MSATFDVVCGMEVSPETADSAVFQGKTYYFCCDGCKGAFERSPEYHLENWAEEHPDVDPSPA